jgi:hypothetical protein
MKPNAKRRSERADLGIDINAEWSTGPRTPAWDRLWRFILSDLDPEPVRPNSQQRGRGGYGG